MNRPRIIKSGILPKLKIMLLEDISVLRNMLEKRNVESHVFELIESLIDAKQFILEKIPGNESLEGGIPSTPDKAPIQRYRTVNTTEIKDQVKLVGVIYELERDQMRFVQQALRSVGLPSGIKNILNSILNVYLKVTDQLDRAIKTNQIEAVVV